MRLFLLALLALLLAGCSKDDGLLHGAAAPVPLYKPSRLQDLEPIKTEWVQSNKRDKVEWVWKTTDPSGSVTEFYKKALPDAKVETTDDGVSTFTWTSFPGAEPDESVVIRVEAAGGVFRVTERMAPHKHKQRAILVEQFPEDNDVPAEHKKK